MRKFIFLNIILDPLIKPESQHIDTIWHLGMSLKLVKGVDKKKTYIFKTLNFQIFEFLGFLVGSSYLILDISQLPFTCRFYKYLFFHY